MDVMDKLDSMNPMTTLAAPCLLVSAARRGHGLFEGGVILLLEHDAKGSMGLLLNRPSQVNMTTFLQSVEIKSRNVGRVKVYQGGPVQTDRAFLLHQSEQRGPETETVVPGIQLSYSLESLRLLVEDPPAHLRVYLGYSGWGPGQLAKEIALGHWLVASCSPEYIFESSPELVWEKVLRDMGIQPGHLGHSTAMN